MKPTKENLRQQEELVRRMVNKWDPVALLACGSPEDEYDCITHRVLSGLHTSKSPKMIAEDLLRFIPEHFGSSVPLSGAERFATQVLQAWTNQQQEFNT